MYPHVSFQVWVPEYLPGYGQQNQVWYPVILGYIPYKTRPKNLSLTLTSTLSLTPTLTLTLQDANVIGGDFRLAFSGYTTSTIAYDATASELGVALSDLPSVDSVDVSRLRVSLVKML